MKKLFIAIVLVLSTVFAFAGDSLTQQSSQALSDGQTVHTHSLDGNKLTISVCEVSQTAEGTYSRCVSETQKLTAKEVAHVRDSIRYEQQTLLASRVAVRSGSISQELSHMQSQSSSSQTMSKAIASASQKMTGSAGVLDNMKSAR